MTCPLPYTIRLLVNGPTVGDSRRKTPAYQRRPSAPACELRIDLRPSTIAGAPATGVRAHNSPAVTVAARTVIAIQPLRSASPPTPRRRSRRAARLRTTRSEPWHPMPGRPAPRPEPAARRREPTTAVPSFITAGARSSEHPRRGPPQPCHEPAASFRGAAAAPFPRAVDARSPWRPLRARRRGRAHSSSRSSAAHLRPSSPSGCSGPVEVEPGLKPRRAAGPRSPRPRPARPRRGAGRGRRRPSRPRPPAASRPASRRCRPRAGAVLASPAVGALRALRPALLHPPQAAAATVHASTTIRFIPSPSARTRTARSAPPPAPPRPPRSRRAERPPVPPLRAGARVRAGVRRRARRAPPRSRPTPPSATPATSAAAPTPAMLQAAR